MSIYIYERKRLENWVDAFCEKFRKSNPNLCINKFSEHNISEGYSFNDKFEFFLKNNITRNSSFCDDEIYQIINRCRLLRSLDKKFALKLIIAAEYSIDHFIKEFKPTLFIAPRIDSYILDILDRKLTKIDIKFIGFWRSAFLKDHFFLTKRGEVNTINKKINSIDVEKLLLEITDNKFKATSIIESNKFSLFSIIKIYFYLYFRDVFLEFKRNLGFYKFGYRELTNRFNVKESAPSLSGVLLPFKFKNFNIETLNSNFTKNIFIALQVNPESTIDYYSSNIEFINIENTLLELINTLTPFGYKFYIKDHPNMFGKRDFHFLKKFFINYDNVYYVPYSFSSNELILKCNYVFTWSGTVCIQAFLSNRVPITICSPYKIDDNNFIILKEFADFKNLNNLLLKSHSYKISEDSKRELISLIISTLLPGKLYLHNNKKITDNDIDNLINILDVNKILQL